MDLPKDFPRAPKIPMKNHAIPAKEEKSNINWNYSNWARINLAEILKEGKPTQSSTDQH